MTRKKFRLRSKKLSRAQRKQMRENFDGAFWAKHRASKRANATPKEH